MGDLKHCNICSSTDLLRMHQYGVNNHQKIEGQFEQPEVNFEYLICLKCGFMKVDLNTIKIKEVKDIWTGMKLKGEGER